MRNEKLKAGAEELNPFAKKRQVENLFRSFKDDNNAFTSLSKNTQFEPGKLKDYFNNSFKSKETIFDPDELMSAPNFINKLINIGTKPMKTSTPQTYEIDAALKQLKNGKTSKDIPAAFLKHAVGEKEFLKELTTLYKVVA